MLDFPVNQRWGLCVNRIEILSVGGRDFVILGPENRKHTKVYANRSKRCNRIEHEGPVV